MFQAISGLFSLIRMILDLIKFYKGWMEEQRAAEALKRQTERELAIEDQAKAQTEKDFDDAQDRIVSNKPH